MACAEKGYGRERGDMPKKTKTHKGLRETSMRDGSSNVLDSGALNVNATRIISEAIDATSFFEEVTSPFSHTSVCNAKTRCPMLLLLPGRSREDVLAGTPRCNLQDLTPTLQSLSLSRELHSS